MPTPCATMSDKADGQGTWRKLTWRYFAGFSVFCLHFSVYTFLIAVVRGGPDEGFCSIMLAPAKHILLPDWP